MTKDDMLVVVPARGGSRRLKRKAMRDVLGKPLIWYTLDYVQRIGLAHRTVVVTDDDEITQYTSHFGCGVVMEPPVPPDGECSVRAVYRAIQAKQSEKFGIVVVLQPTNPVRSLNLVARCVNALRPEVDSVSAVLPARSRPEWCLRMNGDGLIQMPTAWDASDNLATWYELCGTVFVCWRRVLSVEPTSIKAFHEGLIMAGVVHNGPACDVDTKDDLVWFEFLVRNGYTIWDCGK